VDYAQEECLVYIICSDSNSVKTYLTGNSVPLHNIKFLITSFNSIWCRDYGPWTVYSGQVDTARIVDWIYNRPARPADNNTPVFIANYMGVPIHQTLVAPNDLVNTGGNFMVDGHGTGFASKLILTENQAGNPYGVSAKTEAQINNIMNSYMGISRYIKMDLLPYDVIHHIDMHIKLLDEETLLVSQYPPGIADGPQIEANLQYVLNNFQTCFGKPYKVVRILAPPHNGNYPPVGNYRTYTNSVIVNKTVIVPTYEFQYDTTALRIYRESMPGYNIVGINCNAIIPSLGAIHCITKEIGVSEPVFISHSAIRNTSNTTQPYEVKAYLKSKSGIASARMYWSTDTSNGFTQVNMTNIGDTFRDRIIHWHLIGHLQTNKVKFIVPFVFLVHSLDSLKLAQRIQLEAAKAGKVIKCLVQVNTSGEDQKSGCDPKYTLKLVKEISLFENLRVKGLMTIGKLMENEKDENERNIVRGNFRQLKELFEEVKAANIPGTDLKYLSMGMTSDYDIAIEEGSNMLRVGSAIFGKRN
jgi:pyridoxal phosphate enzyme (YggS family)